MMTLAALFFVPSLAFGVAISMAWCLLSIWVHAGWP